MKTVNNSKKTYYRCSQCNKEFKYESEKSRHELSHISYFVCDVCNKKFSFVSALRRHKKQHVRTGSVQCPDCYRTFKDEALLKRHIQYAHKGVYSCTKCEYQFSSETALGTHMKIHKPKSERKYQCSFNGCEKTFNFSHHLRHHELTHSNEKQHFCNICKKGFIQSHHLKTHLKTHDPDKWLHCKIPNCEKKFATEYSRKRHMATHKVKTELYPEKSSMKLENDDYSSNLVEDTKLCISCGQLILCSEYEKHTSNCGKQADNNGQDTLNPLQTELELSSGIRTCESALGSCIVTNSSKDCLCIQISSTSNTFNVSECINENNEKTNKSINYKKREKSMNDKVINKTCSGCECSNLKTTVKISNNVCPISLKSNDIDMPTIEYNEGTVRLKEAIDLNILNEEVSGHFQGKSNISNFPQNSCKEILGNCIVSGNATMGEGCLCARMNVENNQDMEQEIADLTPQPMNNLY